MRTRKVLETAKAALMSKGSSDHVRSRIIYSGTNVLRKSLERTRWYKVGDSVAPEGLDCKGECCKHVHPRVFSTLRETYNIPTFLGLLRPTPEDRPFYPRNGFSTVTIGSLICGLRLPFRLSFSVFSLD